MLALTNMQWWLIAAAVLVLLLLSPVWARVGIVIHHCYHTQDTWRERVQRRFRQQGTMAWMFTWFKLRLDAMFQELPTFFEQYQKQPLRQVIDIGCGYGMTGCALLEWSPQTSVFGLDPSAARAKVAQGAFGDRGSAAQGGAPDFLVPAFPQTPGATPDAVFMLDVIHFLNDDELALTLQRIKELLEQDGRVYIRAIIPPAVKKSLLWRFDTKRRKLLGVPTHHRTIEQLKTQLIQAGFDVLLHTPSGNNPELAWFIAGPAISAKA